jgi:hypothetical protein
VIGEGGVFDGRRVGRHERGGPARSLSGSPPLELVLPLFKVACRSHCKPHEQPGRQLTAVGKFSCSIFMWGVRLDDPGIDMADPTQCPPTDERGVTRPQGPRCDIGAYELVAPAKPTCDGVQVQSLAQPETNQIYGTKVSDAIVGLSGDDEILGLRGDDSICGGEGKDKLGGGRGRDRLFGDQRLMNDAPHE